MTNAIQSRPAPQQQRNAPAPISAVIDILSACLTRVRPVGMSDDAATEWLTVCATDVAHLPESTLRFAAKEAGKTVTRHGEIIPAILASSWVKDWERGEALARSMRATHADYLPRYSGAKQIGQVKALQHIEVSDD